MEHLPGILNPSDDLTKPLGWVLHARRGMGHHKIGSPVEASSFSHSPSTGMETHEAGEGDGARFKGDRQSRGVADSGLVKECPGSSRTWCRSKDPQESLLSCLLASPVIDLWNLKMATAFPIERSLLWGLRKSPSHSLLNAQIQHFWLCTQKILAQSDNSDCVIFLQNVVSPMEFWTCCCETFVPDCSICDSSKCCVQFCKHVWCKHFQQIAEILTMACCAQSVWTHTSCWKCFLLKLQTVSRMVESDNLSDSSTQRMRMNAWWWSSTNR